MSRNVTIGVLSYKIEQDFQEGKLILELYFDNPSGDIKEYANFVDAFHVFLKEKGYAAPVVTSTKGDIDEVVTKISKSLGEQIANSTQGVYNNA
ncbi:hypothetical protein C2W64_04108 [Brevibacillus laterosporus]|nr:hypothetical protein [Brevibacillus laterosporus]RAP29161.1 hypothetical protein C2W64_04108 [Brevibacillus laterosporus]